MTYIVNNVNNNTILLPYKINVSCLKVSVIQGPLERPSNCLSSLKMLSKSKIVMYDDHKIIVS